MKIIEGVKKIALVRHADDRGYVQEILRCDDPHFQEFGQVYVSVCRRNVIKAWHAHRFQTDHFCVLFGTTKIGIYDDRPDSPTRGQYNVWVLGELGENALVIVPPGLWHGQMALSEVSYLLNIPTKPYNRDQPDELRKGVGELEDIWTVKSR